MRKLKSFTFLSIDGFYKDIDDGIGWHKHGQESKYSEDSLQADDILLFGRKTFEMMSGFWPTQLAADLYPKVAEGMNQSEKIVISNSLKTVDWQNTSVVGGNIVEQIRHLKQAGQKDLTILGSGSIVRQLTDAGLIDRYEIMIDPVALGQGVSLFDGIARPLTLKLIETKILRESGIILLIYEPGN